MVSYPTRLTKGGETIVASVTTLLTKEEEEFVKSYNFSVDLAGEGGGTIFEATLFLVDLFFLFLVTF